MPSLTVPDGVLAQSLDGETVLLHLGSEFYYGLDEVGSMFWAHLAQGATWDHNLTLLQSEFEVDRETLESDLLELVKDLKSKGLLLSEE